MEKIYQQVTYRVRGGYFEDFDGCPHKQAIKAIKHLWEKRTELKINVKNYPRK